MRWMPGFIASVCLFTSCVTVAIGANPVHIVIDDQAPALEKLAAQELKAMVTKLSKAEVTISSQAPNQEQNQVILLHKH